MKRYVYYGGDVTPSNETARLAAPAPTSTEGVTSPPSQKLNGELVLGPQWGVRASNTTNNNSLTCLLPLIKRLCEWSR